MKTIVLKKLILVTSLIPTWALALDTQKNRDLNLKLNSLKKTTSQGLMIKPIPRENIEKAISEAGGIATIEFGKSGGVIVGSGADGLIADSNVSTSGGAIVAQAPIRAKNASITVVGNVGSTKANESTIVCALKLPTDQQGNILFAGRINDYICSKLGVPLRFSTAGKFLLRYSNSFMVVDLKSLENKIIPLREISIPTYKQNIVRFSLWREGCSSIELKKSATVALSLFGKNGDTINSAIENILEREKLDNSNCDSYTYNDLSWLEMNGIVASGESGQTVNVFPGSYRIQWTIDTESAETRNLIVD